MESGRDGGRGGGRGGMERGALRKGVEDVLGMCGAVRVAEELSEGLALVSLSTPFPIFSANSVFPPTTNRTNILTIMNTTDRRTFSKVI